MDREEMRQEIETHRFMQAKEFMDEILGATELASLDKDEFFDAVGDGVVLCNFINRIMVWA